MAEEIAAQRTKACQFPELSDAPTEPWFEDKLLRLKGSTCDRLGIPAWPRYVPFCRDPLLTGRCTEGKPLGVGSRPTAAIGVDRKGRCGVP